jgi:hypothetical protein
MCYYLLMGAELQSRLLDSLEMVGEQIPDRRRAGGNLKYRLLDGIKCAFAVFFFLHPSLLDFQRAMKERRKRDNLETLFRVGEIPSDNQIRTLLDGVEPSVMGSVFERNLRIAEEAGLLEGYRVLDGGVLLALDGLWYYSSREIHCEHCLHKTNGEGETTYCHSAVAGALVRPGSAAVIPVMGEPIRNGDGNKKQDCEHEAGKRWLMAHGPEYRRLKATLLGDDLYADQPFCRLVLQAGMSFLFTCKADSHPWLTETIANSYMEEKEIRKWTGRAHQIWRLRWINGAPLRDSPDALLVNYLSLELRHEKTGKIVYRNSWITNKELGAENVEQLAVCGRTRWKIENEHNNVLKNRGYNLEHNFGHGKNHAAEMFFLLNLLAFQMHTILELGDEGYRKARATVGRRDMFFYHMQAAFRYALHETWQDFLLFVRGEDFIDDDGG